MKAGGEGQHLPVLPGEVLEALQVRPDGFYVDATFGRGGHARAILARLGDKGELLAIDRDPDAVAVARQLFASEARAQVAHGAFSSLGEWLAGRQADGILLDLGVSSPQLDDAQRGFSFQGDGPLDMRMDPSHGEPVSDWLARATEREISDVIFRLGEDRHARRIARVIVDARATTLITSTRTLAELVARAVPRREPGKHPATRTFQAFRLHINQELAELEQVLPQALAALAPGGRLAVISFHSLEDRIVKRFMRDAARGDPVWAGLPNAPAAARPTLRLVSRAQHASVAEVESNPRSRSAVLRVAERLAS